MQNDTRVACWHMKQHDGLTDQVGRSVVKSAVVVTQHLRTEGGILVLIRRQCIMMLTHIMDMAHNLWTTVLDNVQHC